MSEKVLITSALLYANGPLHFGHIAGAYLPADVYKRFMRLLGNEALYICGSDEYGVAITLSAEMAGHTPKEHVDIYDAMNRELFKKFAIEFDHFGRTTWEGHVAPAQQFFQDLLEGGYIEKQKTEQLFSEKENRFLADRYVIGTCPHCKFDAARGDECPRCGAAFEATDLINPRSKITQAPLIFKQTEHYFLRFDLFKRKLKDWLSTKHWKSNVLAFAQRYVDDLKPRAISRDSKWGVPVPLDEAQGKVLYVWFDAPIGYISITQQWSSERWKEFWLDDKTRYVQFIGKDNIPFHAIFFPAMCMGQKTPYKMVDDLPANEFLTLEGRQFSKSSGWTIDLERFFKHFTSDQIRYYLATIAPESSDSEFNWQEFQNTCNSHLVGKLGNFANRVLTFTRKTLGPHVPPCCHADEQDRQFIKKLEELECRTMTAYHDYSLRRATQSLMAICDAANSYFDAKKPWKLEKGPVLETTMSFCLHALKLLATLTSPIIPTAAHKLWALLGYSGPITLNRDPLPQGQTLPEPEILFSKIEDAPIQDEQKRLDSLREKNKPQASSPSKPEIDISQFEGFDLRVGEILHAESVPKSKKLLKLTIDIGTEKRTVVSGIATAFPLPDKLIGKRIALIANLKPRKIMGIESCGMLLLASDGPLLEPLFLSQAKPGSPIN